MALVKDGINAVRRSVKPSFRGYIADDVKKIKRNKLLETGPNIIGKLELVLTALNKKADRST
jgi:hypothetical protein